MRDCPKNGPLLHWLIIIFFVFFSAIDSRVVEAAPERIRVGVALGGGGARGLAHVGILRFLEELRIPVDCIAGTSMGSIIGGLYAAGMTPNEMEQTLQKIDWPTAFTDGPPRADLPFRVKQEQRVLLTTDGIGIKDGQAQLPKGLLEGQNLLLLLEELSLPTANVHDFDQLAIPYRAVATDLATGAPVVLKSGELAKAMRASMSIPSALAPVELDGKLLVDGGVSNNVPVDVVRALCHPDVTIAVDVGAPLEPANKLTSVLSITNQLTSILTVRNVQEQLKTLKRKDILITPDLKDISSINFERSSEAVQIGYTAAADHRNALRRLSVTLEVYQAYRSSRPALPKANAPYPIIDFIRIKNNTRLSDQVIVDQLHIKPGDQIDPQRLNRNLNVIYGMGGFQQVNYSLTKENGKTGLIIEATEKYVGTNTINFGLFLGTNMKGDSLLNISAAYTMAQMNTLGGEWRNFLQIGGNIKLETDLYQPIDTTQEYYLNPYANYQQYDLDVREDSSKESTRFRVRQAQAGIEIGRNLEHWGRLSLGLHYKAGSNDLQIGRSSADEGDFNDSGYSIRWVTDTLDSLNFPRSGYFADLYYYKTLSALGADQNSQLLSLSASKPYTWGQSTLIPRLHFAGVLSGNPGPQNLFLLGGFLNLSGYQIGQISGQYVAFGELIYMIRLDDASAAFTLPLYAGGSLEVGGAWDDVSDIHFDTLIPAGSLFLGADTPLGPLYLGAGLSDNSNASLYLLLGKLF